MGRQDIEVFLALAQELHFARTAQRLNLAPASISQTIKKLERRFGAHLFTRTTITLLPGFQEMLAYVTSGHGVAIVGTQTEQLYPRPGLTCVPITGRPTFDYAPVWRTDDLNALASNFLHEAAATPWPRRSA